MSEQIICKGNTLKKCSTSGKNFPFMEKKNTKNQTVFFRNKPSILGRMSVVGPKEGEGPISSYFHKIIEDEKMGQKSFELAENEILKFAIDGAVKNSGLNRSDIDCLVGGDLLNQITSSGYVARAYNSCFLGMYSACSTMTESLAIGSMLIDSGYFSNVACSTVSHFATAERQFRFPLEYGCQRPPYSQWTVTGAGSIVLGKGESPIKISSATIGKVIDFGIDDLNNMGAAMAPACMSTMIAMLEDTNTKCSDYDLILSGDLGKLGSDILRDLMKEKGYRLGNNYHDCGCLVYDGTQKCYQGGSGAGCSASVVSSFVLDRMEKGEYNKVAYFATGALMSSQSCFQGETIPCISHAVVFERS